MNKLTEVCGAPDALHVYTLVVCVCVCVCVWMHAGCLSLAIVLTVCSCRDNRVLLYGLAFSLESVNLVILPPAAAKY